VATRIAVLDGSTLPGAWISAADADCRVAAGRACWVNKFTIEMIPMVREATGSRRSLKIGEVVAAEFSCGRDWARSYVSDAFGRRRK
jgi:hypothetical protein